MEPDGSITWAGHQELDPTLEYAKEVRDFKPSMTGAMVPVATIPPVIWDDLERIRMTQKEFNLFLRKWANDPANKCFRLTEGQL